MFGGGKTIVFGDAHFGSANDRLRQTRLKLPADKSPIEVNL